MEGRDKRRLAIVGALCVVLLAAVTAAQATPVEPLYAVAGLNGFGSAIAGPMTTNFGSGFYCTGTLKSTVRQAAVSFDINGDSHPDILPGDVTFVYNLKAGTSNTLDYLQVHLVHEMKDMPLVVAGYNTLVSQVSLTRLNTETELSNFQLEFGNSTSGAPGAFGLGAGKTLEMFVTFRNSEYAQVSCIVDGSRLPTSNIAAYGAVPDPDNPPIHTPEPATLALVAGGLAAIIGYARKRR